MDLYSVMQQHFARIFGRQPNDVDLADFAQAVAISLYAQNAGLESRQQLQQRITQMLTPGTQLNAFLQRFK